MLANLRPITIAAALFLASCETASPQGGAASTSPQVPIQNLGTYHREVTTSSPQVQKLFDQGLILAYAFNHTAAIRAFEEATRLDPGCAMAWWGVALVQGPHINNPSMLPEKYPKAWDALQKAQATAASSGSPVERGLVEALATRYTEKPPEDRRPLDEAYAGAMRRLWQMFPADPDVGTLYAESMMDLHPWDFWTIDGTPKPGTEDILATLEKVLALRQDHPGANHLYIHAVEASPRPERAIPSADRLRTLVPDAGHLVHMPAHIDVRTGHFAQAAMANVRAIVADEKYAPRVPGEDFYRVYMAHNHHFLAFASMMEGRSSDALSAARTMVARVPPKFIEANAAVIDSYLAVVLHVLVRFGRWEDVLREPPFPENLPVCTSVRHYARGVALAALGRLDEAEEERKKLEEAVMHVSESGTMGNNPARTVLQIPRKMLAGEIAFRRGDAEEALRLLREAATIEDGLIYDEPPDWMQPVRHALGAILLKAGRIDEAELAYRQDLQRFPENGWSLFGLARCLERGGAEAEARGVDARFLRSWSRADVAIRSSCFCQPGG